MEFEIDTDDVARDDDDARMESSPAADMMERLMLDDRSNKKQRTSAPCRLLPLPLMVNAAVVEFRG